MLSGGQRQRLVLARALLRRSARPSPRRADGAPRPVDGAGVMDDVLDAAADRAFSSSPTARKARRMDEIVALA